MAWYAQPRQTRDIDIVIDLLEPQVETLVAAFSNDFYLDADTARAEVRRRGMFNMIQDALVMKVDLILRKNKDYDVEAFRRRQRIEIASSLHVDIIAPEDLVLAKMQWAKAGESELQLRDVRNLVASVPELDMKYLSRWARELGVGAALEKVTSP